MRCWKAKARFLAVSLGLARRSYQYEPCRDFPMAVLDHVKTTRYDSLVAGERSSGAGVIEGK